MTTSKQDKSVVNTGGGGAYVGGGVTTGRGNFIGRDKLVGVTQSREGASLEEFLALLTQMRALFPQAGFEEHKARTIEGDLRVVEGEAKAPKPDGGFLVGRLEGIRKLLEATGGVTETAGKLLRLAQKAWEWGRTLFPAGATTLCGV
jgi:hypothetical protein